MCPACPRYPAAMAHTHTMQLRTPLVTPEARVLLGAAMQRCKPCRWSGGQLDLEAIEDLYVQWARYRTIAAIVDGRDIRGTLALERITGRDDHLHWPESTPAIQYGRATVTPGPEISVDPSAAMDYVAELNHEERARLVDDLLDGLVGSEFYPGEYLARLGLAR